MLWLTLTFLKALRAVRELEAMMSVFVQYKDPGTVQANGRRLFEEGAYLDIQTISTGRLRGSFAAIVG